MDAAKGKNGECIGANEFLMVGGWDLVHRNDINKVCDFLCGDFFLSN